MDTENITYYRIISGKALNIPFNSLQYTEEGALYRCLNLTKEFTGVQLVAKRGGIERVLYPTAADEKRRAEERRRNTHSYQFQRLQR